jgi:protein SCO1/2
MKGKEKKNRYKILIILFTLVIPVLVYVFLRAYGENHYAVPVFYETGIPTDTTDCITEDEPHLIRMDFASDDLSAADRLLNRKLSVVDIDMGSTQELGNPGYSLNRVVDKFAENPVVQFIVVRPSTDPVPVKQLSADNRFIYVYGSGEQITEFARCELILLDFPDKFDRNTRRFVLIDNEGRIRGYYEVGDFDEIDRMILEMKIILSEEYD